MSEIKTSNVRICGIKITSNSTTSLLLNVYMPVDHQSNSRLDMEYTSVLDELEGILHSHVYDNAIICGDFNTDFRRHNLQSRTLVDFNERNDLCVGWNSERALFSETYANIHLMHSSCIDHFIMSEGIFETVLDHRVVDDPLNWSSHNALMITFALTNPLSTHDCSRPAIKKQSKWHKATAAEKENYRTTLTQMLNNIRPNPGVLTCVDKHCADQEHLFAIDNLCELIIRCCLDAAEQCIPQNRPTRAKAIVGWHDQVEHHRQTAIFWHRIWVNCNRTLQGPVYEIMKKTRHEYHYSIRYCKLNEMSLKRKKLADNFKGKPNEFWQEVKRLHRPPKHVPSVVDNVDGSESIAEMFANKFEELYQSVPTTAEHLNGIREQINQSMSTDSVVVYFSDDDVRKAIGSLKTGKSDGECFFLGSPDQWWGSHLYISLVAFKLYVMSRVHSFIAVIINPDLYTKESKGISVQLSEL